ncbi:MAG: hypothetical protein J5590_08510, partial [Clostridia bacterium]|nr:hypothetical protein [Clostridia bacterium]
LKHVVITNPQAVKGKKTMDVYVNGVYQKSVELDVSKNVTHATMHFFGTSSIRDEYWKSCADIVPEAKLGGLKVYDGVMSGEEVADLYCAQLPEFTEAGDNVDYDVDVEIITADGGVYNDYLDGDNKIVIISGDIDPATSRVIVGGAKLYYVAARDYFVGIVPAEYAADEDAVKAAIRVAPVASETIAYGKIPGTEGRIDNSDVGMAKSILLQKINNPTAKQLLSFDVAGGVMDGKLKNADYIAVKRVALAKDDDLAINKNEQSTEPVVEDVEIITADGGVYNNYLDTDNVIVIISGYIDPEIGNVTVGGIDLYYVESRDYFVGIVPAEYAADEDAVKAATVVADGASETIVYGKIPGTEGAINEDDVEMAKKLALRKIENPTAKQLLSFDVAGGVMDGKHSTTDFAAVKRVSIGTDADLAING